MASKALANAMRIRQKTIDKQIGNILGPLNAEQNEISKSLRTLTDQTQRIQNNADRLHLKIDKYFNELIENIQRRKEQINSEIELIQKKKLIQIQQRKANLSKYQEHIDSAIVSCKSIINDNSSGLSISEKKQKVKSLSNEALNSNEMPSKLVVDEQVQYSLIRKEKCSDFVASICRISDNTLCPLPNMINLRSHDITPHSTSVSWTAELPENQKLSSNLIMTITMTKSDEKVDGVVVYSKEIPFVVDQKEYCCHFEGLSPNHRYKAKLTFSEIVGIGMNGIDGQKLQRTDVDTQSVSLRTSKEKAEIQKFEFQRCSGTMKVSEDGLSVMGHGQLRFGQYLKAENAQIYRVTFSMKEADPENCGIGFATTGFINSHNNHRMLVYGNGKVLMAKNFKNGKKLEDEFWNTNDGLVVEVDMKNRKGIMFRKFTGDLGIDHLEPFYEVRLPQTVAICVRFSGKSAQKVSVLTQKFVGSDKNVC